MKKLLHTPSFLTSPVKISYLFQLNLLFFLDDRCTGELTRKLLLAIKFRHLVKFF